MIFTLLSIICAAHYCRHGATGKQGRLSSVWEWLNLRAKVSGFTAEVIAPGHLRAEAVNYKNVLVKKGK